MRRCVSYSESTTKANGAVTKLGYELENWTDVSQPETCDEQTRNQKPLLQNNKERTNRNTTDTMEGPETTATTTPLARDKQHI